MAVPKNTQESLEKFAKYVVSQSRANLTRGKKNASKELWDSIGYELDVHQNSFTLKMIMEDYGIFQDRGVKGVKSGKSLDNFSYKSKGGKTGLRGMPPPKAFDNWNVRRGRAGRNKKGQFLTRKQLNFVTALNVFKFGIKPSMFFTKPFEKAFKNLPQEVVEAFGLDVTEFIKFTSNGKN